MNTTTMTLIITGAGVVISALISFLIASMRIGEYKGKVDRACTDITKIENEQKGIRDKVIACETSLKEREPLTRKKSPVTLTERGTKVLNDSTGKKFIDDNYEELKKKVNDSNPETSYDIQELSRKVVEDLKDDSRLNTVKEYLFKEGMEIEEIINVLGIHLRDKILSEKGIGVDDIDKHTPNAKK